jgi:hypothetical protein
MNKFENDPNLKEQLKVLSHHPPHTAAPHGHIRKMKPHMAGKIHEPRKEE